MIRYFILFGFIHLLTQGVSGQSHSDIQIVIKETLKKDVLSEAVWALQQQPITVTNNLASRSSGTIHDFYSEGDYWWPDSTNTNGPYIQRDGVTNPDNFTAHRLAMIRLSKIMGALASAYIIENDKKYVYHAIKHLKAWFIDRDTRMNPNLQFAQAIKGRATGRGIGIIDTIHLMEVAQGILAMKDCAAFDKNTFVEVKKWFSTYLLWLTSHPYGKEEMNAKNNHGTCWVMQVASFAKLTGDSLLLDFCRERFKTILLPEQMAIDGSFPLELKRTKPYGYSIFNLDAMTMICQIASDQQNDLYNFKTVEGKSIQKGIEFIYPYINTKSSWPYPQDVMHWNSWPVAQPCLLFGAVAFHNNNWLKLWKELEHNPKDDEVIRNLPIRHPLIWFVH